MIIYKYVDVYTLGLILRGQRIMFSHPVDFNDPFDRPRVSRAAYGYEYTNMFTDELMTREKQAAEADSAWGQCAVSSFTRTYDNPLMWAHYAEKHKGAVLEIDAEVAELTSENFLIPVQFGSVIYMKRPNPDRQPARRFSGVRNDIIQRGDDRLAIENYEGLQRLFLSKGLSWAYEEEVRVVCDRFDHIWNNNDENLTGSWKKITKGDGNVGYAWRLPSGSITKVFTGLRFSSIDSLREQARLSNFQIMCPDASHKNDYEVHFLPDIGRDNK